MAAEPQDRVQLSARPYNTADLFFLKASETGKSYMKEDAQVDTGTLVIA